MANIITPKTKAKTSNNATPTIDPAEPLKNQKHELFARRLTNGEDPRDIYISLYPDCKSRETAAQGASRINRRAEIRARVNWLTDQRNPIKEVDPAQECPDLGTRAGRLRFYEVMARRAYEGDATGNTGMAAIKELITLHGDREQIEMERTGVDPVQVCAYLIRAHLDGISPREALKVDLQAVAAAVVRALDVDACLLKVGDKSVAAGATTTIDHAKVSRLLTVQASSQGGGGRVVEDQHGDSWSELHSGEPGPPPAQIHDIIYTPQGTHPPSGVGHSSSATIYKDSVEIMTEDPGVFDISSGELREEEPKELSEDDELLEGLEI